jgi:hypothetical protein
MVLEVVIVVEPDLAAMIGTIAIRAVDVGAGFQSGVVETDGQRNGPDGKCCGQADSRDGQKRAVRLFSE